MATQPANIDCHKPILIDAQETYRTLINSIRDYAIYLLDPTGIVLTWNTGAERIKGYSANEIIGHSFTCLKEAIPNLKCPKPPGQDGLKVKAFESGRMAPSFGPVW
jgi:transcriptional regulator with PAS, ATPase and Fis domain